MTPYPPEDFAFDNYAARRDGTDAQPQDSQPEELTTKDREQWTFRVLGEADMHGLRVVSTWAICWCTDSQHHLLKRYDHCESRGDMEWALKASRDRGDNAHPIRRTTVTVQSEWEVLT